MRTHYEVTVIESRQNSANQGDSLFLLPLPSFFLSVPLHFQVAVQLLGGVVVCSDTQGERTKQHAGLTGMQEEPDGID